MFLPQDVFLENISDRQYQKKKISKWLKKFLKSIKINKLYKAKVTRTMGKNQKKNTRVTDK
jgi:hypothetical protein